MTLYLVEHRLRRAAPADVEALHEALGEVTRRLAGSVGGGSSITYVRSTVIEEQHRCICVFEATSEALVRSANELAQLPNARVLEAVDYIAAAAGSGEGQPDPRLTVR